MKVHELTDELSNQKLTKQFSLIKGKINLDGKLVETIMPFTDIEAFENFIEAIDEHYDEGPTIFQEADSFLETDKKDLKRLKQVIVVNIKVILIESLIDISVGVVINQENE